MMGTTVTRAYGALSMGRWAVTNRNQLIDGEWTVLRSEAGDLSLCFEPRHGGQSIEIARRDIESMTVRERSFINYITEVSVRPSAGGATLTIVAPRGRTKKMLLSLGFPD